MHLNYIPAFGGGGGGGKILLYPTESKAGNMFVIGTHKIENRLFEALLNMLLHSAHSPHGFPSSSPLRIRKKKKKTLPGA